MPRLAALHVCVCVCIAAALEFAPDGEVTAMQSEESEKVDFVR